MTIWNNTGLFIEIIENKMYKQGFKKMSSCLRM